MNLKRERKAEIKTRKLGKEERRKGEDLAKEEDAVRRKQRNTEIS